MGNLLSSTPSEDLPSPQRYATGMLIHLNHIGASNHGASGDDSSSAYHSNIRGNYSGNTHSNNISIGNTTININPEDTNPSRNHAKILQCPYTSRYGSHRARVREPAKGTCTWVTQHQNYLGWSEKKAPGLLWLSADPGCGKSVTASFLVNHLKSQGKVIVRYFFFKDDNREQKSATFALCAILHQLFSERKQLCIYAEKALEAKGEKFTEEVDTLWDILVTAVAKGGCGDVICVVDALDECEEETLDPLIRHVTRHSDPRTPDTHLRFLVTSRPYHKIERGLGSPVTTIRLRGEDEVKAITSDVSRVINEGIEGLESYWGRPGELYLRNLLESSADRTFLWVSLVLGILKDCGDGSSEEFIKIVSTAPRDLAELYTKILDRGTYPDKARRILDIVVAAARPLTLREMNIAFRIRRDNNSIEDLEDTPSELERTVKNVCGLFVRVIDSKIYLVHQTAREFLIKGSLAGKGNWQYTLCPKDSNFVMADICICYLSREEFSGRPLAIDTRGMVSEDAVKEYLEKYSFLDYAARHWADHYRDSQDKGVELFEFTRQICGTGSKHCGAWFQVHWFNTQQCNIFPKDFTHLMIASFFGQGAVVDRLLTEGDVNARSKLYGTALNIAAVSKDEGITKKLLQKNVKAYLCGKEYDILHTKKSELEFLLEELLELRLRLFFREFSDFLFSEFEELEELYLLELAIEFLKHFCAPDTPDPHAFPGRDSTSSSPIASPKRG